MLLYHNLLRYTRDNTVYKVSRECVDLGGGGGEGGVWVEDREEIECGVIVVML